MSIKFNKSKILEQLSISEQRDEEIYTEVEKVGKACIEVTTEEVISSIAKNENEKILILMMIAFKTGAEEAYQRINDRFKEILKQKEQQC